MAMIAYKCPDIQVVVVDINAARIAAWNSDVRPQLEGHVLSSIAPHCLSLLMHVLCHQSPAIACMMQPKTSDERC